MSHNEHHQIWIYLQAILYKDLMQNVFFWLNNQLKTVDHYCGIQFFYTVDVPNAFGQAPKVEQSAK